MNTKAVGNIGEQIACEYLEKSGYTVIERNAVCCGAEIDIVAEGFCDERNRVFKPSIWDRLVCRIGRKGKNVDKSVIGGEVLLRRGIRYERTLVFCEVKTRADKRFGSGAEAVDAYKAGRYISAAKGYLHMHGIVGRAVRFDIVEICDGEAVHTVDAFCENDAKYHVNR